MSAQNSNPYVLIAVPNVARAAAFRQTILDTLALDAVLVRDGEAALQALGERCPALLIVDLSLPRVDGFAVIRRLRRQSPSEDVRVIVVAAHESLLSAARELAAALSISAVLPIEVDAVALQDALRLACPERRPTAAPATPEATTLPAQALAADIDEVIDRAAVEARRRFQMPVSIGYTRIGHEDNLTFHVATRGSTPPIVPGEVSQFDFLRQVAAAGDPLVVPRVDEHPVFAERLSRGAQQIRGFAAVPVITSAADVIAALCLLDTKTVTLSAADIDALAAFGRSVGKEIDGLLTSTPEPRASLDVTIEEVKTLQHLAATDPLTGLANRRGGEKNIASEIARAKREKRPLSCILVDVDRFKQVNDTYGHQAGDQLLRDISALLRRTVRAYDVLVRWGGEEFLLVLPGVDLDVARALAERVRAAVEMLDTHGIGAVTISAGTARFEADYDFASTLRTADQRLYQAKAAGRNKVI
jgi:diguanylate cyclase (GGDEF)-like protein